MENNKETRKYCVYMHVDKEGVPFYVGHGTIKRAYKLEKSEYNGEGSNRSKSYKEKIKSLNYVYDVVIHSTYSDKSRAAIEAGKVYDTYKTTLTNNNRPYTSLTLDRLEFAKHFVVDLNSPSKLSRIIGNKLVPVIDTRVSRSISYYIAKSGCKTIPAHRVIMLLLGNNIDGMIIDHKDGNGLNNDISNLRVVSHMENSLNTRKQSNNKTGTTGVSYSKWHNYYVASWVDNGVLKHKRFSVKKLGKEIAFNLAVKAREDAIKYLIENGAGYTDRHGK